MSHSFILCICKILNCCSAFLFMVKKCSFKLYRMFVLFAFLMLSPELDNGERLSGVRGACFFELVILACY